MPALENKLILIVDDNVTNLKVAIEHLQGHGIQVIIARNGESGLERAVYARPDLILLDVQMPGIDGYETCRRLKANEQTKEIPVIFMTSLSDVQDKVRAFSAGGVDFVIKPIEAEEVWVRVKTHLTIHALQQEMAERIEELNAFAGTVAHDLKSPLGRIITGLDLLYDLAAPALDEKMRQILKISVDGGHQMSRIIDELLLLASLRQDDIPIQPVVMAEVVTAVQARLDHMFEEYEAEMILPATWSTALGYGPWLEEVWVNYLSNGLKYGGRPPRLQLGSDEIPNGTIRFWVKDNGAGLSDEEQAQLFGEFSRVHRGKIEGHGLGLSIVRRIISRLGGEVGVESKIGEGSTFYFTLPQV